MTNEEIKKKALMVWQDKKNRPVSQKEFIQIGSAFYHDGQKAAELTWEDIRRIVVIADSMLTHTAWDKIEWPDEQAYYTEVLKRFMEERK